MSALKNMAYFNSIKVRLKLRVASGLIMAVCYFNSIKVRLKQAVERSFQFSKHISIP